MRQYRNFLMRSMNNVGHAVIEEGIARTLSSMQFASGDDYDLAFQWRLDSDVLASDKPLIIVSSSGLHSRSRPEFDEQGDRWTQNFLKLLSQPNRKTLIVNIGLGGIRDELRDFKELSDSANQMINTMATHRNLTVWAREEFSTNLLSQRLSVRPATLGCPSFAVLGKSISNRFPPPRGEGQF